MYVPTSDTLLLNKPRGWSSHQVVNWVRKQTGEKRVGHTGSLDPLATGLLIILVGRQATKRQHEFLKLDKRYSWEAQLGVTSDTYDSTGEVERTASESQLRQLSEADVLTAVRTFTGKLEQTVPAFSAVKRQGKKLYELARAGKIDLETLPSRAVEIYSLELEAFDWVYDPRSLWTGDTLRIKGSVHCSSGTYVRSLIHDIGQALGVGAVLTDLHRTAIGRYSVKEADIIHDAAENAS